jgi:hypothetical protein
MNQNDLFREIIKTYQKFGWSLRLVLLNENAGRELTENGSLIPENIPIQRAPISALWFSRISGDREAWELRLLSQSPFALIETFEQNTPESEREKIRAMMVEKLQGNELKFKV